MPIIPARRAHQQTIRQLLRTGRFVYANFGSEDLDYFLHQGYSVLGMEQNRPWGFICLETEERPPTLPAAAPDRSYVRSVALARGRSPAVDVAQLLGAMELQIRWHAQQSRMADKFDASNMAHAQSGPPTQNGDGRQRALQISYFGADSWLKNPLLTAGFHIAERVEFLHLTQLPRRPLAVVHPPAHIDLRPAHAGDLDALTRLDASTFDPFWHFGPKQMMELLLSCRVTVAEAHGDAEQPPRVLGYSALSFLSPLDEHDTQEAHLARLAVHPDVQGSGLGRILLGESLHHMQQQRIDTVLLNTQTDNHPAQQLYRSSGFRSTGQVIPLFVKEVYI